MDPRWYVLGLLIPNATDPGSPMFSWVTFHVKVMLFPLHTSSMMPELGNCTFQVISMESGSQAEPVNTTTSPGRTVSPVLMKRRLDISGGTTLPKESSRSEERRVGKECRSRW